MKKSKFLNDFGMAGLIFLFLLSGCGPYRIGTTLPAHMRTVYVITFENNTREPGIEVDITNAVIDRFRADGNLRPVSQDEADTVLRGEIVGWERWVLGYSGEDEEEVEEYRLYVSVLITFEDSRTAEILITRQKVQGHTDFFVGDSLPESEQDAYPEVFKDLARRIVDSVISVW